MNEGLIFVNHLKVNILAQLMIAQNIFLIHLSGGHILIVVDILDYMKMEKKNAKSVEQKIYFVIGIMLAQMIIKIKNLIVIK